MSRRISQLVAGLVLIFATVTPLANCFDTWDKTTQSPACDTELQVTALFAGAGFILVLPKLVRRFLISATPIRHIARSPGFVLATLSIDWLRVHPTASPPPMTLRI